MNIPISFHVRKVLQQNGVPAVEFRFNLYFSEFVFALPLNLCRDLHSKLGDILGVNGKITKLDGTKYEVE